MFKTVAGSDADSQRLPHASVAWMVPIKTIPITASKAPTDRFSVRARSFAGGVIYKSIERAVFPYRVDQVSTASAFLTSQGRARIVPLILLSSASLQREFRHACRKIYVGAQSHESLGHRLAEASAAARD